jgi:hypothetical protein
VPLRVVFRALAREAEELVDFSAKLDDAFGASEFCDGETLQNIDRMMQYAGALRELCVALSETERADAVMDVTAAVRQIRLDDVINRVSYELGVGMLIERAPAGDCDLF